MHRNLFWVQTRLAETIQANFKKPIEIECVVDKINNKENYFTVTSDHNTQTIECHIHAREKSSLDLLQENDNIFLKGWVKIHPDNMAKIYIDVDSFYPVQHSQKYNESIKLYKSLCQTLNKEQYKPIINRLKTTTPPKIVNNVALIVMPNDLDNINNFKDLFQKMCCGKLYIFRLDHNNMEKSIRAAVEYFRKYHDIDMICFLTNKVSMSHSLDLSSKDIVKYLFNRKNFPYIVSIIETIAPAVALSQETNAIVPLTNFLSNRTFSGITSCIDFIHGIQNSYAENIQKGINMGKRIINEILEKYRRNLFDLQMCMTELNDVRFNSDTLTKSVNSPFDKLKELLIKRLTKERFILCNIYMRTMKLLVEDPRINGLLNMLIERESQGLLNPRTCSDANVIDSDLRIKQTALHQNTYYQRNPEHINPAIKFHDAMMSTMIPSMASNTLQKIENKRADNSPDDMVSINIQRQNGEF